MYFSTAGMSDRQRSSSRVRTNEDKMFKKDLFWSVRADKLPDVSDPGLEEAERYKMVSEPTLVISRVRVGQGCGHGVQPFGGYVRGHLGCTVGTGRTDVAYASLALDART